MAFAPRTGAENWQYGTEVLTNYGPLGFVGVPFYHPSTWVPSLGINLLVLLLTVVYLTGYWRALRDDPWPSWLWLFFVLVPAGLAPTREWAPVQALPYMIVLASVFRQFFSSRPAGPIAQCALGVLLAIFLMMKLMFLSIIGLGLMVVTADEVFRRRRLPDPRLPRRRRTMHMAAPGPVALERSAVHQRRTRKSRADTERSCRSGKPGPPGWRFSDAGLPVHGRGPVLPSEERSRALACLAADALSGSEPGTSWSCTRFVRPDRLGLSPRPLAASASLAAMVHPLLAAPETGRQRKLAILPAAA